MIATIAGSNRFTAGVTEISSTFVDSKLVAVETLLGAKIAVAMLA